MVNIAHCCTSIQELSGPGGTPRNFKTRKNALYQLTVVAENDNSGVSSQFHQDLILQQGIRYCKPHPQYVSHHYYVLQ